MSYSTWSLLFLISVGTFVVLFILIKLTRIMKNRYYHSFHQDELIKETKTVNSKNALYFTYGETFKFIKKYVICKTASDKYLVCNYTRKFKRISYYVIQYGITKKIKSILKITEVDTNDTSKIITLKPGCKYVNVVVCKVEDLDVNSSVIRPVPLSKIKFYAFLRAACIFMFLFALRHIMIVLICGDLARFYTESSINEIICMGIGVIAILNWIFTYLNLRKKNLKSLSGGVLEYEFL